MVNEQNYVNRAVFLKIYLFISRSNRLEKRRSEGADLVKKLLQ